MTVESSVPVGSTGEALRTFAQTTSEGLVQTEAVALADPTDTSQVAQVTNDEPFANASGIVARIAGAPKKDIFGHQQVVQPYNQVELRLDASDWADYVTQATSGGGSGGTITQSGGVVTVASGTAATGSATLSSTDSAEYRPGVGLEGGGTAVFPIGTATSTQYAGIASDTNWANGLAFGRKAGVFGIRYTSGGSEIQWTPQASWNIDPCSGAADSQFTLNGTPITLDPANYGGPYLFGCGLFGYAGWIAFVWSPDYGWIPVHQYKNNSGAPIFQSNTFKVVIQSAKTSGATSVSIRGQCWMIRTGSPLMRLGDIDRLTDRSLVQPGLVVIAGKSTAGGTQRVEVKVNPSGTLAIGNESVGATGAAVPASATLIAGSKSGTLQAIAINANNAAVVDAPQRTVLSGLSFVQTLSALGSYQTAWVDTLDWKWLDFYNEVSSSAAVTALIEFTDASAPNVTPPGSSDIVRQLTTTVAGTALGGPANVTSFGLDAQMRWARITVTDLTGGQTIKVRCYAKPITPTASQLPLAASVTPDFKAPLHQAVTRAFDPGGTFRSVRFSGIVASQSSTTTLLAGADFTGSEWIDTTGFVGVAIFLKSDAVAAANGLKLQLSFDNGSTVHYEDPRTYDAAPDASIYKYSIVTPGVKVRVKLTAGASNMTNLVLKTYLLAHETEDVSVRVGELISGEMVGDVVKAQLVALNDASQGVNVSATDLGNLRFSVSEHEVATPIKAMTGGGSTAQITVGTSAVQIDSTTLPNRVAMKAKADEDNTNSIWYGYSNAVTTSTGFRLSPGEPATWDHGPSVHIWAISDAANQKLHVEQAADTL